MTEKEDWIFSLAAEGTRMDPRVGGLDFDVYCC